MVYYYVEGVLVGVISEMVEVYRILVVIYFYYLFKRRFSLFMEFYGM